MTEKTRISKGKRHHSIKPMSAGFGENKILASDVAKEMKL
jgi:hypothetical protein